MDKLVSINAAGTTIYAIKLREYDDGIYTSAGFVQEWQDIEDTTEPLWINSYGALELPIDWPEHLVNKIEFSGNNITLSNAQYTITDIDWEKAQALDKEELPSGNIPPVFKLSDGSWVNRVWFTQDKVK